MRLALVGGFLDVKGGSERFTLEIAKRFLKRGIDVRIFCHRYDPDKCYAGFEDIPIESIDARTNLLGRFSAYFHIKNLKALVSRADRWSADTIFLQSGFLFGDYLQKLTRKPIVSYVHWQEGFGARNESAIRDSYRNLLGLSETKVVGIDHVQTICNSHYTARMIRSRFPTAKELFVVYPGVDHKKFRPTWQDSGYMYYHSRYGGSKNQKFAAEMASHIEYPLVLSGFLDSRLYKNYYDELASNKPHNVTMLTNISDDQALSYLQNCSVFLFPSINEHFGMATVEAMACGKPVIGHNSGATPEITSHVGYLCGDDLSEWIERVKYLMGDRRLRQELGLKSHETAKMYSWDRTVVELEKIFYSAIR